MVELEARGEAVFSESLFQMYVVQHLFGRSWGERTGFELLPLVSAKLICSYSDLRVLRSCRAARSGFDPLFQQRPWSAEPLSWQLRSSVAALLCCFSGAARRGQLCRKPALCAVLPGAIVSYKAEV